MWKDKKLSVFFVSPLLTSSHLLSFRPLLPKVAGISNLTSNSDTSTAYNLSRSITSQSQLVGSGIFLFCATRSLTFSLTQEKLRQILLHPRGNRIRLRESKMISLGRDGDWRSCVNAEGEDEKVLQQLCQWAVENCSLWVCKWEERKREKSCKSRSQVSSSNDVNWPGLIVFS